MKADGSLALISYRLERSRESLRAAEIMIMGTGLNLSPLSKRIYNEIERTEWTGLNIGSFSFKEGSHDKIGETL